MDRNNSSNKLESQEIKIIYFEKDGKFPEGIYALKEPNIWYPVVRFRKSKPVSEEIYKAVVDKIAESLNKEL